MSNHIFEEGPRQGHAAGSTSVEQQASQLSSDIKYKARQKMKQTSGSALSPAQVQALYRQLLNASPAPGAVKSIVKQKLFKEQVDCGAEIVSETVKRSKSNVFGKIFVEGGGQKVEEVIEEDADQKFIVRVTDKTTGNTSYRKADRAKISQLRANPNISSVEITGRKKADDAYGEKQEKNYGSSKGKNTVGDKDGDGTKEPDRHEYAGVKDRAIKKSMAKEEVIYEKEDNDNKKLDVMKKGKNNIKVNPTLGESIRAELDLLKAQKIAEQDASMKQQEDEKKKEALAAQQGKRDKMMKLRILQNKMRAVRGGAEIAASHELEGDTIAEGDGCEGEMKKGDKKEGEEDPRSMPAKINLAKNKLRAMGLKMSYDMEGDMVEATEDSLKDRRMERGGVDGNNRYKKPISNTPNTFGKKKPKYDGMSAVEKVKASITAKYGQGAIMDTKKK